MNEIEIDLKCAMCDADFKAKVEPRTPKEEEKNDIFISIVECPACGTGNEVRQKKSGEYYTAI